MGSLGCGRWPRATPGPTVRASNVRILSQSLLDLLILSRIRGTLSHVKRSFFQLILVLATLLRTSLICTFALALAFTVQITRSEDDLMISGVASRLPPTSFVVDVTKPPYMAKGDGIADDTSALQQAINDNVGLHRAIYLPKGTYLVSTTLTWPKRWKDRENWGFTLFAGHHAASTRIRLKDSTFTDLAKPQAIMRCGGFGSADWFHNYVEDLTFDVGQGNPGATALQFYSNNSGAVRRCEFRAPPGSGAVGLDLAHSDMNGPLLVSGCVISGFRKGIVTGHAVNSQTFELIKLDGQTEVAFENQGQIVSIRDLFSSNSVPALKTYGMLCMVDSTLMGQQGAEVTPAIINYNGGSIFLRDVSTSGYKRALADVSTPDISAALAITGPDRPGSEGPLIREYASAIAAAQHDRKESQASEPERSLRLPAKPTPQPIFGALDLWTDVDTMGADPMGIRDSSPAIQKAIDSGATNIVLPGSYRLLSTIVIRGNVQRVVGLGGQINYGQKQPHPDFRITDGVRKVVFIEHFGNIFGGLEIATRRTVVLRSVSDCDITSTDAAQGGDLFLEDVVTHHLQLRKQNLWGVQVNIENEGMHLENIGGSVCLLGYKTERGGTLLRTSAGGRSEILGGFSYTTTSGKLAPMFINDGGSLFTYFTEICFNGDPFETLVEELRDGQPVRRIRRGNGSTTATAPYSSRLAPKPAIR